MTSRRPRPDGAQEAVTGKYATVADPGTRHPVHTLTAFFAENVNPKGSWVHVFEADPKGDHALADQDNVRFPFKNPKEITVGLPRGLRGTYTVMWFTVSADDGHKAGSAFTFRVR